MGFKEQSKKVVGCSECRLHALCMYCLGLVERPKKKKSDLEAYQEFLDRCAKEFSYHNRYWKEAK